MFHLDISGRDIKELHSENILFIFVRLDKSHFDISGNEAKLLQLENIFSILKVLSVSQFEISGKFFNKIHS